MNRVGLVVMLLSILTGSAACSSSPVAPTASTGVASPRAHAVIDRQDGSWVLSARLYTVGSTEDNNSVGTLELWLTESIGDPHIFVAISEAHLLRLDSPFTAGSISDATNGNVLGYEDPDERNANVTFRVEKRISSDFARTLIGSPDRFRATFYTAAGPAASGRLELGSFVKW